MGARWQARLIDAMQASSTRYSVCSISDLPEGQSKGFRLSAFGPDDFFLVNQAGVIHGYRNSCPHWPGASLPLKRGDYLDESARYIVCHGHNALFEIETGRCISGPCLGERLTPLTIEVDQSGTVFILTHTASL